MLARATSIELPQSITCQLTDCSERLLEIKLCLLVRTVSTGTGVHCMNVEAKISLLIFNVAQRDHSKFMLDVDGPSKCITFVVLRIKVALVPEDVTTTCHYHCGRVLYISSIIIIYDKKQFEYNVSYFILGLITSHTPTQFFRHF